jgi:hypothetical protein
MEGGGDIMRFTSFVLGSLAGAAVGALLAPRRGVETRRAVGHRLGLLSEEEHERSSTAVAAEMLAAGVSGTGSQQLRIPHEDPILQMGDPDVDPLNVAYVGDEVAGGDMPTPGHDDVDNIGRAYGVTNVDDGALRTSAELLEKRDRRERGR